MVKHVERFHFKAQSRVAFPHCNIEVLLQTEIEIYHPGSISHRWLCIAYAIGRSRRQHETGGIKGIPKTGINRGQAGIHARVYGRRSRAIGQPQAAVLLAAEWEATRGRTGPVTDGRAVGSASHSQGLSIEKGSDSGPMPSIKNLLGNRVVPQLRNAWNIVTPVYVYRVRPVAGDILKQLVIHPLIAVISQSFRPRIVGPQLESPGEAAVDGQL